MSLGLIPADAGLAPDARLRAALAALAAAGGATAANTPPRDLAIGGEAFRASGVTFQSQPMTMHLLATREGVAAVCHIRLPAFSPRAAISAAGQTCRTALAAEGGAPAPRTTPAAERPAVASAPPVSAGAHPENWSRVAGVYFRSTTGFGVGGMMIMDFEPLVLFNDGAYYEIDDAPLEDVDLARSKTAEPRRWGRWRGGGTKFALTDSKGQFDDVELQQGRFFKAYPAEAAGGLAGAYESMGGGGNSALGGGVTIAVSGKLAFSPDGRFTSGRSTGALSPGVTASARRGGGGRFTVSRHTLTLTHADGRTERRFFAYSSEKTPPRVDRDMIFIGDTVHTLDD